MKVQKHGFWARRIGNWYFVTRYKDDFYGRETKCPVYLYVCAIDVERLTEVCIQENEQAKFHLVPSGEKEEKSFTLKLTAKFRYMRVNNNPSRLCRSNFERITGVYLKEGEEPRFRLVMSGPPIVWETELGYR